MDGIGHLLRARYSEFEELQKKLEERISIYRTNKSNPNKVLAVLERDLLHASNHIRHLKTTFTQMVFGVTEFQHCYLELLGLLDYLEIYKPRMDGILPAATTVANCFGAFTHAPNVVQDFFTAGLPVWFTQPLRPGQFPHNVLNMVAPFEPAKFLYIDQPNPPSPIIYDGPSNVYKKHNALHRFSRTWLVLKDPFEYKPSSTTLPSTSTMPSTSSQAPTRSTAEPPHCK